MTSSNEKAHEIRRAKAARRLQHACEGGIEDALRSGGHVCAGLTIRTNPEDVLITVRAHNGEGKVIAFCGASDVGNALTKLLRQAKSGELRWREDRWGT